MKYLVSGSIAKFRAVFLLASMIAIGGLTAQAAGTDTWAGPNGTNWTAAGAFTPNDPATGDLLLFTGTTAGASSVDNETNGFSLGGITFNATAQAYTISGNTLNLTGTVESDSANTETISDALTTGTGNLVFKTTAGGTLSLGAFAQSVNNLATYFQGTGNFIVGGLSTTGNIGDTDNFQNTGNVTITGPIAQSSGGGGVTVNMANTGTTTIGNVGSGAGSTSNSSIVLNFSNTNTSTISGNIVTGNDVGSIGAVNINLGVVPTYAAPTPALYTGTVTLSGNNDFFGTVTVNSGTLVTASATALKSTLPTVIAGTYSGVALSLNGGTLDLDGTTQTVRYLNSIAPLDYTNFTPVGGTITNNGSTLATLVDEEDGNATFGGAITDGTAQTAVTFESASYQDFTYLTGNNTYTGATTIKSMGVVAIGAESSLQYGLNAANYTNGSLSATTPIEIQGGNVLATAASVTYPGTLIMDLSSNYTLSNLLSGSGRLLFEGTGTTTLTNTNTFNGSVVVNSGTAVLDFSGANAPTDGNNVLYHGATYAISNGVSSTGSTGGAQTMALGNGYQLSNAAGANYVPVAVGDYLFANGALGVVTSVDTSNNTFTISGGGGAQALESAVLYAATGQSATASVTSGTATISGIDYSNLQVGETVAITLNGTTTVSSIKSIDTTTGIVTLNNYSFAASGTATLAFDNAIENALYMGNILDLNTLTPTATATNPGQANLDIQGGNGGVSTQTVGFLDLSGVSGGTGLGGANGNTGNASNITLLPGTGGNKVVFNIGYLSGGAGGGSALNFTLPTNPDGTLASDALVTIADPTFNASSRGNSAGTNTDFYVIPYINGRQQITINGNDFAAVDTVNGDVVALSSLSNSVATTASNYFQYAYTTVTAATNGASAADPNYGNIDVVTGGGTATLTSGGANAYRFNEANKGDTLTFNQVNATTGLGSTSYLSNLLVTSAVGANVTDINGTNLTFSTGSGGNRLAEIFQNNPNGILEIDNHLSNTASAMAQEGPGTVVFTATNAQPAYTTLQGTTVVTGDTVAPSFVFGTTAAASNVITFTTPNATAGLYVGESLGTGGTGVFITSLDASTNTATISQNYGTTNTTAVSLDFIGGGGLGAPGAGIAIENGATLMLGSGNIKLVTTGAVDNTDGSLFANQAITNNGVVQINWTGSNNPNTNNNTLNNNMNGIGQLVLATPTTGTMTLTLEGNNGYEGGTIINDNTTLVLHQAAAGTGTGSYTLGSNVVTLASTAGLAVGETITSTDLGAGGASGTATILAINGNTVTLNIAATGTGSGVAVTTAAYGANALAVGGNRDSALGTTGDVGYGVTVNGSGVLDLGGYYLNPGSTTVDNYIAGYLTLNGGTVQDGILQLYFGANLYSGTEAANTSIVNGYNSYIQGLTKSTDGTVNLWGLNTYTNGNGIFVDPVTISGGVLNFATNGVNWNGGTASGLGAESNAATSLVLDGGTLQYTGKTVVLASDGVTAGSTTNPLLNTNGTATSIQATDRLFTITQNGGTIDSSAAYAIQFTNTGADVSTGTGARTLTLTGSNVSSAATGTSSIASVLADASGTGNTLAVSKTGNGTWSLNGNNTYSGGTTVSNGILAANNTVPASGTASATGSGLVTVQSGGAVGGGAGAGSATAPLITYGPASGAFHATLQNYTLGKVGSMTAVEITSGGILNPGNNGSVGTLTTGILTMDMGALMTYDFGSTANSLVAVTGTNGLTLNGGTLSLFEDGTTTAFDQVGIYNIFSYTGTIQGTGVSALTANLTPGTYTFINDTADHLVQLDITSVPEPGTWLMMFCGLGLLVLVRRSRSRLSGN